LNQRTRWRTQGDELGSAIARRRLAMHQALCFETVQQSRQGRPLHRYALSKLTLAGVVIETGEVQKYQPPCLGKAKVSQPPIQLGAPAARQLRQLHGESVLLGVHGMTIPKN